MNRDVTSQGNLSPDTLTGFEVRRYRNAGWLKGSKLPPIAGAAKESPTLVDAKPYGEVVRALIAQGYSRTELAFYADCGYHTIRDLEHGKASVQQRTADKVHRLVALLPEETA